ncbi:MAG: helix-turn-helix domain-containing protein [Candidatus Omnitrophica bacterium]|nr:helix-turn-helix domain-containing protein [Candidatus Omnitrophota bacterium]
MNGKIIRGTDNIFKDIGVSDPERTLIRAQVMSHITEIINERNLNQKQAGKLLNLTQPKVSNLMNGKLSIFSLEHLFKLLTVLKWDVEIIIKPKSKTETKATTSVLLAA